MKHVFGNLPPCVEKNDETGGALGTVPARDQQAIIYKAVSIVCEGMINSHEGFTSGQNDLTGRTELSL